VIAFEQSVFASFPFLPLQLMLVIVSVAAEGTLAARDVAARVDGQAAGTEKMMSVAVAPEISEAWALSP
jgi:hypothetical protein